MSDKLKKLREYLEELEQSEEKLKESPRVRKELDKFRKPTGSNGHSGQNDESYSYVPEEDR